MKIALLNTFYFPSEPGGAERSVRSLAEGLVAQGNEVIVICLGDFRSTEQINGVLVERFPVSNLYLPSPGVDGKHGSLKRVIWHFRDSDNEVAGDVVLKYLSQNRPDVLHTNNISGFSVRVWWAASSLGIRVVHTARDFYLLCPKTTMMKSGRVCTKQCIECGFLSFRKKKYFKYVNKFVFISEYMRRGHLLGSDVSVDKSAVIYNSYDAHKVSPARRSGGDFVLGFIGRLDPAKGVELLLEAFSILLQNNSSSLVLRIAGTGPNSYVQELKKIAKNMPVEFLGGVVAGEFFNDIDLTVVPSIWNEPLGRVAIESIAHGKGVVVTPVGGLPELVEPGFGAVSKSLSAVDLADAIRSLIDRLNQDPEAVSCGALKSSKKYSSQEISRLYIDAYQ